MTEYPEISIYRIDKEDMLSLKKIGVMLVSKDHDKYSNIYTVDDIKHEINYPFYARKFIDVHAAYSEGMCSVFSKQQQIKFTSTWEDVWVYGTYFFDTSTGKVVMRHTYNGCINIQKGLSLIMNFIGQENCLFKVEYEKHHTR